jgi:glutamyl-tRNA synthetase
MHIRNLSSDELAKRLAPYLTNAGYPLDVGRLRQAIPIIRERLVTLDDVIPVAGFLFMEDIEYDPKDLVADKLTPRESAEIAKKSYQVLAALSQVTKELAELPMRSLVENLQHSAGQVFGIIRVAVTGQKVSPPLFETMEIIGKEKVLKRIQKAINQLEEISYP